MNGDFGLKELKVWQKSIEFADVILDQVENINSSLKHYRLIEQIEAWLPSHGISERFKLSSEGVQNFKTGRIL